MTKFEQWHLRQAGCLPDKCVTEYVTALEQNMAKFIRLHQEAMDETKRVKREWLKLEDRALKRPK